MKKIIIIFLLLFIPLFVKADEESLLATISKGDNNSLVLNWNNIDGVIEYQVYRSTNSSSGFKSVVKLEENTYTDKKLTYGKTYYYKIVALFEDKEITSEVVSKKVAPNKITSLILNPGNKKIELTYDKTNNSGYSIYRSTDGESFTKIKNIYDKNTTSYIDSDLKTNKKYYYKVRSFQIVDGSKVYGSFSEVISAKTAPSKPEISIKATAYNKISINITSVKGATYYQIKRSTDNKDYETITSTTELTYVDDSINPTVTYYYKVRACNSDKKCGSYSSTLNTKTKIKTPTISGNALVSEVNLNWTEVSYATGYKVYYSLYKDKKYTKIITTSDLSTIKNELIPGETYYFKVRAYVKKDGVKYYSSYSNIITLKPNLKKVSGVKLSATKNEVKINWNETSGATGYKVYMSKSENGTYTKLQTLSDTSYTNTGLKSKTKYYYKVRAYIKIDGVKYYGPYSNIVKIKTPGFEIDYNRVNEAINEVLSSEDETNYIINRDILKSELTWSYEFSPEEKDYAINVADIDWNERAKKEAQLFENSSFSKKDIESYLRENLYTESEIEYALNNITINYNENAYINASENNSEYSEEGLRNKLKSDGFSDEESEYAINKVSDEANYQESAKTIFKKDVSDLLSLNEIENDLESKLFTSDEIENTLLLSSEYDFNEIAFERAFSVVNENNNRELMQTYLENALFSSSEIEYALNTLFKEITSTVDLINLNDPIMVNITSKGSKSGYYAFIKVSTDIFTIPNEIVHSSKIYDYDGYPEVEALVLDSEKANNAVEALNNLPIQKGVNETTASGNDLKVEYYSGRLTLANTSFYGDFGTNYNNSLKEYDSFISTILEDAYIIIRDAEEVTTKPVRLTMDICNEYNLTCDAW